MRVKIIDGVESVINSITQTEDKTGFIISVNPKCIDRFNGIRITISNVDALLISDKFYAVKELK